jgi:hypothetical protein
MQMLSNAMDAMERDDKAALKSFPADTMGAHKKLMQLFADAPDTPIALKEFCTIMSIAASATLYAKTCVLPRVPARDLMRLQIELAGFTGSYLAPLTAQPESRN